MESIGAALAIGIAALGGAIGIAIMMAKAFEGIPRQPESSSKIRPLVFVGIAFIEACVLYAFVIAIMLAGKSATPAATHDTKPATVITTTNQHPK